MVEVLGGRRRQRGRDIQVHPRGNHCDPLRAPHALLAWRRRVDEEGHARPQEEDGEEGESEDQERAAAESVDGEEGWEGEDPVEDACAHGGE